MCEACSDGSYVWASAPRLAAYAKLTRRQVDRLIHGYDDPRTGTRVKGFVERGVLSRLAGPGSQRRTAVYRINEDALVLDPRMAPYLEQRQLPLQKRAKAGLPQQPVSDAAPLGPAVEPVPTYETGTKTCETGTELLWTPCPPSVDTVTTEDGHRVQSTLDTVSTDSKAFDSKAFDSKEEIHHGDAALNTMPAWLAFKEQLRSEVSEQEWNLWVRPMFLLKTMPADGDQKHMLAALPGNGRIQNAALKRLPMMRELLAPAGLNISLTRYPDEYEIGEAKRRYKVDIAPKPWIRES
jgi:hypothetical protein